MASNNENAIIRIYPSFTEVRQDVKTTTTPHQIYVPQDLYNQIMSGSLNLEGVNVLSMNAILRENNLEGKDIHVVKDKQLRKVKMIRSRDNLVQDLETGRFYHVDRSNIEFTEVPEETGTEVTFELEKNGPATLSYLMYGINWKPRYSLNITGDTHSFQGWADINNNTQKEFTVETTELFGGDVNITQNRPIAYRAEACMMMMDSAPMARSAPKIQAQGEVAGLYMYNIPDRYVLAPRSTFSLPFVNPTIKLTRVATMSSYFNSYSNKGQSARVYRISSSEFLPNGSVTVREDGRVVGQSNLPDLSADEDTDLNVGNDPEVSYDRSVKTLEHNDTTSHYEVSITVKSKKQRSINFEYVESFGGRNEAKGGDENTKVENDSIKHVGTLVANGSKTSTIQLDFSITKTRNMLPWL